GAEAPAPPARARHAAAAAHKAGERASAGAAHIGDAEMGAQGAAVAGGADQGAARSALRPPGQSPGLVKVKGRSVSEAVKQRTHPRATPAVAAAQAAAVAPGPAAQAAAAHETVKKLSDAPTAAFETEQFKTALRKKLAEAMPAPKSE